MFDRQFDLQTNTYGYNFADMTNEERVEFIRWNVLALQDELHEALGEVGWKPWATSKHINRDAYTGELVDAWHFFMNLCLVVGMQGNELQSRYMAKASVNEQRQEDCYDGVSSKCPSCKRAYDDSAVKCVPAGAIASVAWCEKIQQTFAALYEECGGADV